MPLTPDRFPGVLEEERIKLTAPPQNAGEIGYDPATGTLQSQDAAGVFNSRTGGEAFDEKAKVSSNDQQSDYLVAKIVAGDGIEVTEQNDGDVETLRVAATGGASVDEKVKVSANDTVPGYLNGKLVAGRNIVFAEENDGGDETLKVHAKQDIDLSWQPIQIGEKTFSFLASCIFRGITLLGIPTAIKLIGYSEDGTEPVTVRIVDVTNGGLIVASVAITNATADIVNMGALANLAAGEALWEIQGLIDLPRGADGWLHALTVQF